MPNISSKELIAIEDQLAHEELLVKKYRTAAAQCTDPAIKAKCEQIASKHQDHFNKLFSHLQ